MRLLLFALIIASGSEAGPAASLHLEIDGNGNCRGAFASMEHPRDAGATVILEDGWVDSSLVQTWGVRDATLLEPGEHRLEPGVCHPRRLTLRQVFGAGPRRAGRSWTLPDVCPVAWEVEAALDESDRLRLRRLTLTSGARLIGVTLPARNCTQGRPPYSRRWIRS